MAARTPTPATAPPSSRTAAADPDPAAPRNEVQLRGRVGAPADERELPSGDLIATFRVVVARPAGRPVRAGSSRSGRGVPAPAGEPRARAGVDTIDVVCWTAASRRVAARLVAGDVVEVEGALRRRFFGVPGGRASRYEVEAARVRRVSGGSPRGT